MNQRTDYVEELLRAPDERQRQEILKKVPNMNVLKDIVLRLAGLVQLRERELELMQTDQEFMSDQALGGLEKHKQRIQRLKDENKALVEENERLLRIAPELPNEGALPPELENDETFSIKIIDGYDNETVLPAEEHCLAVFSIVIRHGKRWEEPIIVKNTFRRPIYPGTADDLINELNHRVLPILRRAPTIDDIPDWAQLEEIPKAAIVNAMMDLSITRYVKAVQHEYQVSVSDVFNAHIKPHLSESGELTEITARDLFRKLVDKSFENMESHRNIPASKPQLPIKVGRPRKKTIPIKKPT